MRNAPETPHLNLCSNDRINGASLAFCTCESVSGTSIAKLKNEKRLVTNHQCRACCFVKYGIAITIIQTLEKDSIEWHFLHCISRLWESSLVMADCLQLGEQISVSGLYSF